MPLSKKLVDAAKTGDQKTIQKYLDEKGNIDDLDEDGKGGLLHHAIASHQNDLVKFLLANKADPNLLTKHNPTYKLFAVTPLHRAAGAGNIEGIKILLGHNVEVDVKNTNDVTPLHSAAARELESVKFLISKGANINARTKQRYTPLHNAVSDAKLEIVKFLISKGADVNARTNEGYTPMHMLCMYKMDPEVKRDIVQQLIQSGKIDLDVKIQVKINIADFNHYYFYSLVEFAIHHDEFQVVELIEAKQRSDAQISHTIQSQLLQTMEQMTKEISTLKKKVDQTNLSQDEVKKSDKEEEKESKGSFFGFTPQT